MIPVTFVTPAALNKDRLKDADLRPGFIEAVSVMWMREEYPKRYDVLLPEPADVPEPGKVPHIALTTVGTPAGQVVITGTPDHFASQYQAFMAARQEEHRKAQEQQPQIVVPHPVMR